MVGECLSKTEGKKDREREFVDLLRQDGPTTVAVREKKKKKNGSRIESGKAKQRGRRTQKHAHDRRMTWKVLSQSLSPVFAHEAVVVVVDEEDDELWVALPVMK